MHTDARLNLRTHLLSSAAFAFLVVCLPSPAAASAQATTADPQATSPVPNIPPDDEIPGEPAAEDDDVPGAAVAVEPPTEIVVTGSRIVSSALTAVTPVAQVGSEDLLLSGTATVENLLNTLPQVVPGESGFTNNEASGAAMVDLRGLGPQRNLILVNGRRFIFFDVRQVTDLNTIPTGLVQRVELITGGSSAVYGSDAISGVVNFILRDDLDGVEATAQYNIAEEGDGESYNLDLLLGQNFAAGRGNVTAFFNYFDRSAMLAGDRERSFCFLQDVIDRQTGQPILACGGSSGIPSGRIGGLPVGAELEARPSVQQALANLGLSDLDGFGFKFDTPQTVSRFRAPEDLYNFNPMNYLQLPQVRKIVGLNAKFEVSPGLEPYFEGIFTNNVVETKRAEVPIFGSALIQTDSPFLTPQLQQLFMALDETEASEDTRNDGYTRVAIGRRLTEVGTRDVSFNRDAWRAVGGLRGAIGDVTPTVLTNLKYDAYYSYARTDNVTHTVGNVSDQRFRQGLTTAFDADGNLVCRDQSDGCVPINIFGPNTISQEAVDWVTLTQESSEEAEMQVATGALTGELFQLPAGPVGFAAGAEWRDVEALFIPPQGGVGQVGEPSGGGYDVWELFGETRVPVLQFLEVTGAFRYSQYSLDNVGGTWTYGAGATLTPLSGLMLRGQYQRAVRAPSVDELFGARSTVSEAATDPCARPAAATDPTVRDLCIAHGVPPSLVGSGSIQPNFQITGIVGGNPDLQEETTDTFTIGAVLRPHFIPRLGVTVDYYNITVNDTIARLGGSIDRALDICYHHVQDLNSVFCRAVERTEDGVIQSPGGVSVLNSNIGTLKTDGVDVNVFYSLGLGTLLGGVTRLSLNSALNWLNSFERTPVAVLPDIVDHCAGAYGLTCGEPLPEWKATSRATLDAGPVSTSLRWRFIGPVTDDRVLFGRRAAETLAVPEIGAEHYFDLSFNVDVQRRFSFFGGVLNLTNNEATQIGDAQEQLNTFPSTYDPVGRRFFIGATVRY